MNTENIKKQLLKSCKNYVDDRLRRIQNLISDIQESLSSETKSTAGDKHETGRAMLQLEREKAGKQLAEIQKLQEIVAKTAITSTSTHISLGNLVLTSHGNYFISISVGQINHENKAYFIIAANTPIGKLLLGKTEGDSFNFNGNEIIIKQVI